MRESAKVDATVCIFSLYFIYIVLICKNSWIRCMCSSAHCCISAIIGFWFSFRNKYTNPEGFLVDGLHFLLYCMLLCISVILKLSFYNSFLKMFGNFVWLLSLVWQCGLIFLYFYITCLLPVCVGNCTKCLSPLM